VTHVPPDPETRPVQGSAAAEPGRRNSQVGRGAAHALRFLLEIVAFGVLGLWGWRTGTRWSEQLALCVAVPALAAALWGQFVAPRARHYLPSLGRLAVECVVLGGAALALLDLGHGRAALTFALLAAGNTALVHVWRLDEDARTNALTDARRGS
jgi:hypothetical protein